MDRNIFLRILPSQVPLLIFSCLVFFSRPHAARISQLKTKRLQIFCGELSQEVCELRNVTCNNTSHSITEADINRDALLFAGFCAFSHKVQLTQKLLCILMMLLVTNEI